MAGKVLHLLERDGRYSARVVVPTALRGILGQRELVEALGGDRRTALNRLPATVARMKAQIDAARAQLQVGGTSPAKPAPAGRRLTVEAIARDRFESLVALDLEARHSGERYAGLPFDDLYVRELRRAKSGEASNEELAEVVGRLVEGYRRSGNTDATPASPEFRRLAMALATAEYEALSVAAARDEGDMEARTTNPLLLPPAPVKPSAGSPRLISPEGEKTLSELLPLYVAEKKPRPGTEYEHGVAVRMFEEFLGEARPVHTITHTDVLAYKRALMETPSNYTKRFPGSTLPDAIRLNKARATPFPTLNATTINNKWLVWLKTLFNWCVSNRIIPDNPAAGIKVERSKDTAPTRIPFAPGDLSRMFAPPLFGDGRPLAERHWAMLIALHTGFRASELAQLKLDSLRHERGVLVFAVEEEVKTRGSTRLTPVHSTLVRLGLEHRAAELRAAGHAHLFPEWFNKGEALRKTRDAKVNQPYSQIIPRWFNRTYLPSVGITDERKVFHSFRHTLKTALARAGVSRAISDDITGHDDRSSGGGYIHETSVEAMKQALEKIHLDGFTL